MVISPLTRAPICRRALLTRRAQLSRRAVLAGLAATSLLPGQTPRYQPKQSDRPQISATDEEGFKPIFNGQSLVGWDGNPAYWRVQDGAIVGEITPETIIKSNTFIVWQGGSPGDFELKLEYRITPNGNSGINYRSMMIPDAITPTNKFAMRGYQCDIDGANRYTGQNYEEKGRLFLAMRGQMTRIRGTQPPLVISSLGDPAELATKITPAWNAVHLIVRGNTMIHLINGQMMSMVVDDDAEGRKSAGQIGVQVHVGPPMKVEYRNIRLKSW